MYIRYHQVKFIERQKLTRLEKATKRSLQTATLENDTPQIALLQTQLQSIAMDQLYIALYPTDRKYLALFTHGNNRVVDDEKGLKKRRGVWNMIREGLLKELKEDDKEGGGDDSSSSCPSSSDEEEDGKDEKNSSSGNIKVKDERMLTQLSKSKKWVNLDAAKKALLSMPADTYPKGSATSSNIVNAAGQAKSAKKKGQKQCDAADAKSDTAKNASAKKDKAAAKAPDTRFAISKELDGMFHESTTGNDYQDKLKVGKSSDSSGDSSSDSDSSSGEDDDADPLRGFDGQKQKKTE